MFYCLKSQNFHSKFRLLKTIGPVQALQFRISSVELCFLLWSPYSRNNLIFNTLIFNCNTLRAFLQLCSREGLKAFKGSIAIFHVKVHSLES